MHRARTTKSYRGLLALPSAADKLIPQHIAALSSHKLFLNLFKGPFAFYFCLHFALLLFISQDESKWFKSCDFISATDSVVLYRTVRFARNLECITCASESTIQLPWHRRLWKRRLRLLCEGLMWSTYEKHLQKSPGLQDLVIQDKSIEASTGTFSIYLYEKAGGNLRLVCFVQSLSYKQTQMNQVFIY